MSKEKKMSLMDKVRKEMPEFVAEVSALDKVDLNGRLAQLAKDLQDVQDEKEADEDLEASQAEARELSAPYRDAKKALSMKSQYIIALAKEK